MNYFFDFDGTLADTENDIKAAWRRSIAEAGLECPRFDELYKTGPSLDNMVAILFPNQDPAPLCKVIRAGFVRNYDASGFPTTRPYTGINEWLDSLLAAGHRLVIASNKRYAALKLLVPKMGWQNKVLGVYSPDMFEDRRMSKTEFLALALSEHHLRAEDSWMVGDTLGDVTAGRENGMHTLAVTWGYGATAELMDAEQLMDAPPPLMDLVCKLFKVTPPELSLDARLDALPTWNMNAAAKLLGAVDRQLHTRLSAAQFLNQPTLHTLLTAS